MEICVECGLSVELGSGRFVNRIPVVDDLETKKDIYTYPEGEYICKECDDNYYLEQNICPDCGEVFIPETMYCAECDTYWGAK